MVRILLLVCFLVSPVFGEWKDLKKELRSVLRSNNPYSAQKKLEECSQYDDTEAASFLISLIKSKRTHTTHRMTSCRVLSGFKNEEVRKLIAKEAKSSNANRHILQVLTSQQDTYSEAVCEELIMRSNDEKMLTVAIRNYGRFKDHKIPILKKMLTKLDPKTSTAVRRSVAEALGSVNNPQVAPILINLMKDKPVAALAIDSMERLTGQSFGNDPGSWRKWLAENKEFKPVNTPIPDYLEAKRKKEEAEREKNKDNDSAEFYGVEIKGENILFVLDKSGSMSSSAGSGTRLDQLKKEFNEMVDTLGYKVKLGVLWFPGNDTYPRTGVEEATPSFKERLKKYINKVKETGSTPIGEAMTYAFEKIVEKREIDAIYLLSDGSPNGSADQVQQLIKDLNSSHFIKIHTISLGSDSEFLKNVAADNYGTYTEIK